MNKTTASAHAPLNPIIILLGILMLATMLTYLVPSGAYERNGRLVVPGSFEQIDKEYSFAGAFIPTGSDDGAARPVSLVGMAMAIPKGLERTAGLIFMVFIIGGMFGVLTGAGVIDAGLERLLALVRGNVYVLITILMIVFSAGSAFLGLASEYLLVIPVMTAMANRLGLSNVIGLAIVAVAVKVGYLASVTNPLPLTIAQPLVGVQIFSGADVRFCFYLVFLAIGIAFVLRVVRAAGLSGKVGAAIDAPRLSVRQKAMLAVLLAGIGFLVYGSSHWQWKHHELSAYYIGLTAMLAVISGLGASAAADAFVSGMRKVLLASMLIGVASAVAVALEDGEILDTIVFFLTGVIGEDNRLVSAYGMFFAQLLLDFLIPSTSGQAAISMPIMGPIGQLSGVGPQTTVLAFLFGNGITNMLTPTSGTLLAYLAAGQVSWSDWARFILPLWAIFIGVALVLLGVAVAINF